MDAGVPTRVSGNRLSMSSSEVDRSPVAARLLVVGGGPAGHAAAAGYRAAGGGGRVIVVTSDAVPPYQRPPLSKDYLRGETDEDGLPLESPQFYRDNDIELWLSDAVNRMNLADGTASTQSGRVVSYSGCVLATGCHPHQLPVPGADHPTVLRLRFLGQAQLLRTAAARAGTAIVIGSGFVGADDRRFLIAWSLTSAAGLAPHCACDGLPHVMQLTWAVGFPNPDQVVAGFGERPDAARAVDEKPSHPQPPHYCARRRVESRRAERLGTRSFRLPVLPLKLHFRA